MVGHEDDGFAAGWDLDGAVHHSHAGHAAGAFCGGDCAFEADADSVGTGGDAEGGVKEGVVGGGSEFVDVRTVDGSECGAVEEEFV